MAAMQPIDGMLRAILDAFSAHDLDRVMSFFAEDCVLEIPRGTEPRGSRFTGKTATWEALGERFSGIPDVRYGDDQHFVAGNTGISKLTPRGTVDTGELLEVRAGDFFAFRDGVVVKKDSYWKICEA